MRPAVRVNRATRGEQGCGGRGRCTHSNSMQTALQSYPSAWIRACPPAAAAVLLLQCHVPTEVLAGLLVGWYVMRGCRATARGEEPVHAPRYGGPRPAICAAPAPPRDWTARGAGGAEQRAGRRHM